MVFLHTSNSQQNIILIALSVFFTHLSGIKKSVPATAAVINSTTILCKRGDSVVIINQLPVLMVIESDFPQLLGLLAIVTTNEFIVYCSHKQVDFLPEPAATSANIMSIVTRVERIFFLNLPSLPPKVHCGQNQDDLLQEPVIVAANAPI